MSRIRMFADTPAGNPPAGYVYLYVRPSDSHFIIREDDGTETDLSASAGGGEANTAANVGAGGVGLFKQKSGVELQFKNINAGSNKVSVTNDAANDEVDIDVIPGNIPHQDLNGAGTNTHTQIDSHLGSSANPHSVTKTQVGLGNVTDDAQLKRAANDISTFTEKTTPVAADLLLIEDSADTGNKKRIQVGNLPSGGGETNTGANVGTGQGNVFRDKTGVTLNFKKLQAGTNVTITDNADEVVIAASGGGGNFDEAEFAIREHFPANNLDLDELGSYGWRKGTSGSGSDVRYSSVPGHPGVILAAAGTNNSGYGCVYLGQPSSKSFVVGGSNQIVFEAVIRLTGTILTADLEVMQIGIGESSWTTAGLLNDAVVVRFNPLVNTAFQLMTSNGGSASVVSGTTPVVLDTWYRVGFVITNPGTSPSVQLYVNGNAEGAPITGNIPTASLIAGAKIDSAGGSTSPNVEVDRYLLKQLGDEED